MISTRHSDARPFRLTMLVSSIAACLAVAACGGGSAEDEAAVAEAEHVASLTPSQQQVSASLKQATATASVQTASYVFGTGESRNVAAPVVTPVAAEPAPADVEATPEDTDLLPTEVASADTGLKSDDAMVIGGSALSLANVATDPKFTIPMITGRTSTCSEGFLPAATLVLSAALPLPSSGGGTYTAADVTRWQANVTTGPYLVANDVKPGTPGDWYRINTNSTYMVTSGGEAAVTAATRATHGAKARDAAFFYLIKGDVNKLNAVRNHLINNATNPVNDFTGLCFRDLSGAAVYDAYYDQAHWLMRFAITYDYARRGLSATDRLVIENYLRRQAYFFATHGDWNLRMIFPNRMSGDYVTRASDAAPPQRGVPVDATWAKKRFDTNGDCKVDGADSPTEYWVYGHINSAGVVGPRLSKLSMWYNNRKATAMAAYSTVGLITNDLQLINRGKRYVMEWLTYGVFADGTEGEYFRNGDYCVAKQGLIYSQFGLQGAVLLSHWLAKKGDTGLINFKTQDGIWGTETADSTKAKSIERQIKVNYDLLNNVTPRFMQEPWKTTQAPREQTRLGRADMQYNGATKPTDIFHDLGLLLAANNFPRLPIKGMETRDPAVTPLWVPGSTGNAVATGTVQWADVFGALPAVYLLR